MTTDQKTLIKALLNPDFYDHAVDHIELIETHISYVLLTGEYAYKIKKPVDFGFLDFTSLEKRQHYCHQELKLNKRLAPDIYLNVVPISYNNDLYLFNNESSVVEYAIKMKQFNPNALINKLLTENKITLNHIEKIAHKVAHFHQQIDIADTTKPYGSVEQVHKPIEQNFTILEPILSDKHDRNTLISIENFSDSLFNALKPVFSNRKQNGFIRECHGDMHLGNIALIEDEILIFDGIEFNDQFRWIDVMSELAFLVMDLEDHHQNQFATHLLNQYLEITGDYQGLLVFTYYKLYRAMVRAKVAGLRLSQQSPGSENYEHDLLELKNYLQLAYKYTKPISKFVAIMHGVSGSGKSYYSLQLSDQLDAIRIRSDLERKRLFSKDSNNLYSDDITQHTYKHLKQLSGIILDAGYPVIIDATFLDKKWRDYFLTLANDKKLKFYIFSCRANKKTLLQRLKTRANDSSNISDADISVMESQIENYSDLSDEEQQYVISIDSDCSNCLVLIEEQLLS